MIRARLGPRAGQDLEGIFNFIADDNSDAAELVRLTILNTADLLAGNPGIGRRIFGASARHSEIRRLVVPKHRNYLIFYRPFHDTIMVVRILNAAQDWRRFFPASRTPTG